MIGVNELIKAEPIKLQHPPVILMIQCQWWACGSNGSNQTGEQGLYLCWWERSCFFPLSSTRHKQGNGQAQLPLTAICDCEGIQG